MKKLRPMALESQRQFLGTLSEEERDTLLSLLKRVVAANDAVRFGHTERPALPSRTADDDQAPAV